MHASVYWFVVGLIAITIEILAPGVSLLGLGLASIAAGVSLLLAPSLSIEVQLLIFSVLAITLTLVCRKWIGRLLASDRPLLNDFQSRLIGREFYTEIPLENGQARMHIGGSYYTVLGEDIPIKTKVRITRVVNTHTLVVKKCS